MKTSLTILFPGFTYSPIGGFKVPLEYANMLASDGYEIHVVYADALKYKNIIPIQLWCKLHLRILLIKWGLKKRSIRVWFPLRNDIKEHVVFTLDYKHVPKTDLYVCTSVDTASYLYYYPISTDRKFYFIQDYENWGRTDEEVRKTYHFNINKIVISSWLQQIVTGEEHEPCVVVKNGFDTEKFRLTIPIEEKQRYQISMLYHLDARKDCQTTFSALNIVKEKCPNLHVNAFGTPSRPNDMPDWYTYYQCPSQEEHLHINNESSIYVAASIDEGWGLTVGEAMLCGQAVACTDNRGFREMAIDGETALLSPVRDAQALANNIIRLIEDDQLRYKLALNGMAYVNKMTQEHSYQEFKKALNLS